MGNGQGQGNHHQDWIGCTPRRCHWWFNYCRPILTFSPQVYVPCQYSVVTCDYRIGDRVAFRNVNFRLGVTGLFLPGKGMGIESVEENPPADLNGLLPGMVITKCNGVMIDTEEKFLEVMKNSNGILDMVIALSETDELAEVTIDLRSTFTQQ